MLLATVEWHVFFTHRSQWYVFASPCNCVI